MILFSPFSFTIIASFFVSFFSLFSCLHDGVWFPWVMGGIMRLPPLLERWGYRLRPPFFYPFGFLVVYWSLLPFSWFGRLGRLSRSIARTMCCLISPRFLDGEQYRDCPFSFPCCFLPSPFPFHPVPASRITALSPVLSDRSTGVGLTSSLP